MRKISQTLMIFFCFRWMNIGYEDDELKPYIEPPRDLKDENRIAIIQQMGYSRNAIVVSLDKGSFDDLHAIYILLGEKKREVKFLNRLGHYCDQILSITTTD